MVRRSRLAHLIQGLNEDLAGELGAIIRYTYQAAKATGPGGDAFRQLLMAELADDLDHATYLTDAIVGLGGEPTTQPEEFDKPRSLKVMLELDLLIERGNSRRYREHAELAGELDARDLKAQLEAMAAVQAGHAQELERMLMELEST